MATISLGLNVTATGMPNLINQSAQFNKNMQAGAAAGASTGGTAGSRAISGNSTNSGSSYSAAKAENTGYNTQRAVGGSTGSATSDFARQASGLGGLVHLYATFAANMFAVSAGFTALSKAMDTSNLVMGLDQIGAASGRNLGSLAKQMVATTNGAISLQQAMTSTAMASSGGMTNDAILRMTEVAKKASLALGRDMTDSMDRLTKGIVKIQPELLDELGIMTRVIPAQQAYAQQIGKTAASLTDFEKRQAFANAVLTEGEKKFGEIKLDTNPYSKILASMQNIAQTGLELVNKVLGPLTSMLAASPTGLAVAMASIAAVLLKQAIPAFGMMKENSLAALDAAQKDANAKTAIVRASLKGELDAQLSAAKAKNDILIAARDKEMEASRNFYSNKAQQQYDIVEKAEQKMASLRETAFKKGSAAYAITATKSPDTISEKDYATLQRQADRFKGTATAVPYEQAILGFKAWTAAEKEYVRIDDELKAAKITHDAELTKTYDKQVAENNKRLEIKKSNLSIEGRLQSVADRANIDAISRRIAAQATETASTKGFLIATREAYADIAKAKKVTSNADDGSIVPKMGAIKGIFTGVSATVSAATTAVSGFMNFLGPWVQVLGLAAAAFQLLDGWMSKSAKEADAFNVSTDALTSSVDNVTRTLDNINSKSLGDFLSVESTQAKATALNELSGSLNTAISKFEKLQAAQGGWDKFFDGFWDMFGKGSGDKLAAGISNTVVSAFQAMAEGPAKDKAKAAIQGIVGQKVDLNNFKSFNDAIKDLDKTIIGQKGDLIAKQLAETAREAGNAAAALTGFKTSLVDIDKQSTVMSNALMPTDNFSKLGVELGKSAKALGDAIQDPMNRLQALRELAGDTRTLSLLPPTMAEDLGKSKKSLDDLSESLAKLQIEEIATKKTIEEANRQLPNVAPNPNLKVNRFAETSSLDIGINRAKAEKDAADIRLTAIKAEQDIKLKAVDALKKDADRYYEALAKVSFDNLAKGLSKALAEAAITSAKGMSDILKQAGGYTGVIDSQLAQKSLDIQIATIKATYENSTRLVALTLEIEQFRLVTEQASIREAVKARGGTGTDVTTTRLMNINAELEANTRAKGAMARGDKGVMELKGLTDPESQKALAKLGSLPNELFGKLQQLSGLMAQKGNEQFKGKIEKDILKPAFDATKEREDKLKNLATASAELDTTIKLSGVYSEILQKEKERNATETLNLKFAQDSANINTNVLLAKATLLKLDSKGKLNQDEIALQAAATLTISQQQTSLDTVTRAKESAFRTKAITDLQDEQAGARSLSQITSDRLANGIKLEEALAAAKQTAQEDNLKYSKDVGAITEATYIASMAEFELKKQQATFTAASNADDKKYLEEKKVITDAIAVIEAANAAKPAGATLSSTQPLLDQQAALKDAYMAQGAISSNINEGIKTRIELTTAHSVLLSEQTDAMQKMDSITQDLTSAFGDMGSAIGATAKAFLKFAHDQEKLDAQKKAAAGDPTKEAKYARDNEKSQLASIASVAAASKKMFSEKQNGYKLLDGVEKAASVAHAAMEAKDLAITASTALAKIGIDIPAIYASFMAAMGPWGAGAAAAAIAMFLGGSSGGASPPPIDQGTLAGTGQQVGADGQTIGTRAGGVLGDPKATAKSLTDSIDGLGKVFFNNLGSNSSNLLKHLKGIQTNTYDTAKAMGAAGVMGGNNPFGASTGSSGGFQTGIGILDNIIGGIFGGGTSTSVVGSGIMGSGTASRLAMGNDKLQGYTDVHRETSGNWFSSGSSSTTRQFSALDKSIQKGISGIFQNFNATLLDTAESLGKSKAEIQNILDTTTLSLSVSNAGLTGTEFAAKLSAEVSVQLNTIAEKAYPFLSLYTKVGEESFQTAARLIKDSETVTFGLGLVGKALNSTLGTVDKIAQQQDLIDQFGGSADEFASAIQTYYDTLFSDSEKARISSANVQDQLIALGYGAIKTKDDLKDLIAVQDLNTEAGRSMYATLVQMVPAFDAASQALQKMRDMSDSLLMQVYDLTDATGAASLALKRANTMRQTDPALKALQAYVFKLEDVKNAEAKLNTQRKNNLTITNTTISSLKTSISTMDGFVTSLESFNKSLTVSADSPLTASQKYQNTQQQFADTLRVATGAANTPEQQKVKNAAIGQLQSMATAFLTSSRAFNASSDQYSTDFAAVQDALTSTANTLAAQKTEAQIQLDVLTTQSDLMQSQIDAIDKVQLAVVDLGVATQAVATAQTAAEASYQEYITGVIVANKFAVDTQLTAINLSLAQAVSNAKAAQNAQLTAEQRANILAGQVASAMDTIASLQSQLAASQAAAARIPAYQSSGGGGGHNSDNSSYSGGGGGGWAGGDSGGYSGGNSTAAIGGWRSGITLVGEHGPEVVDLKTPGRVYNATETSGMFNAHHANNSNTAMVAELKALRNEIVQLRQDQQQQTGHLITAAYDSQGQNAQVVSDAVVSTSENAAWAAKVAASAKI